MDTTPTATNIAAATMAHMILRDVIIRAPRLRGHPMWTSAVRSGTT